MTFMMSQWEDIGLPVFSGSVPTEARVLLGGSFPPLPGLLESGIGVKLVIASSRRHCFNTPMSMRSSTKFKITSKTLRVQEELSLIAVLCTA